MGDCVKGGAAAEGAVVQSVSSLFVSDSSFVSHAEFAGFSRDHEEEWGLRRGSGRLWIWD